MRNKGETGVHGKYYERGIAVWVLLRCLSDKDIKEFWIASNPSEIDKFDDMVLNIQYNNGKKRLFFVQMKHRKEQGLTFNTGWFMSKKSKFYLDMYQEEFFKIVEDNRIFTDCNDIGNDVEMCFCIYTNTLKGEDSNNDKLALQTAFLFPEKCNVFESSESNNVYQLVDKTNLYNDQFLKNFYIYLNQIDEGDIAQKICSCFQLDRDIVDSLTFQLLRKFEPPNQGKPFSRDNIRRDMLDRFFGIYRPPELVFSKRNKPTDLLKLIETFKIPVTVVKQSYSEIRIWCDILDKIERNSPTANLKEWDVVRKIYLEMVEKSEIPLFIKTDNANFHSFANNFLGRVCNSVIIYHNTTDSIVLEHIWEIKDSAIHNVEYQPKISFQGKSLIDGLQYMISSMMTDKKINLDILIKYSGAVINVGAPEKMPNIYINRKIEVPVYNLRKKRSKTINNKYRDNCIPIFCKCSNEMGLTLGFTDVIKHMSYGVVTNEPLKLYFVPSFEITSLKLFNEITSRKKHIHIFEMIDNNYCMPVYKMGFGKCTTITNTNLEIQDTNLIDFCSQTRVNIICNNAGEGKTELFKFISGLFPSDYWVININVKIFSNLINKEDFQSFHKALYNVEKENTDHNFHDILESIYESCLLNQKLVWMIDDYEEIETPQLINILKEAWKAGVKIWIASRPSKKSTLEKSFGTIAMQIKDLTDEEQTNFFENYFDSIGKNLNAENLLQNVHSLRNKLDTTFIGIFQQMVMLAKIMNFEQDSFTNDLNVINIYERFAELQLSEASNQSHQQLMMRSIMKNLAVYYLFSETVVKSFIDIDDLKVQIHFFRKEYLKGSIITEITANNEPIFSHKTYAEYLAAEWLARKVKENHENKQSDIKKVVENLYAKPLRTVRYFFDSILTKDLPMLSAVVNNNYELMEVLYEHNPNDIFKTDILGRTLYHFLIGNDVQYDVNFINGRIFRKINQDLFVTYYEEYIFLEVSKETDSTTLKDNKYDLWFRRLSERFGANNQSINANFFERNLTEFTLLSGSLAFLNYLISTHSATLPAMSSEQTYLVLTYSIIYKFNGILELINYEDLDVTKVLVS